MKISRIVVFLIIILFPILSFAGEFLAQVDQSTIGSSENFQLRLSLTDEVAKGEPNFLELENKFQIMSMEQSKEIRIMNGKSSSSTVWNLILGSKQIGRQMIPSISIETSSGEIRSKPLEVEVKSDSLAKSTSLNAQGPSLIAHVSKMNPYKNESIMLTFELITNRLLGNVELGDFKVNDAIVERKGEPKFQTKMINGVEHQYLVITYLVTPLKEGKMIIPSLSLQAEESVRRPKSVTRTRKSFFGDDDSDPFAQMRKMMENFSQDEDIFDNFSTTRPIVITGKSITLDVLPSVLGMTPWLPTTSLVLSESWSGEGRVGESLTRIISTEADALAASQLPGLEDQFRTNSDFKVYADQPERSEKFIQGKLHSLRKDTFTVVPQKEGEIHFPAVKIAWWDTNTHSQKIAILPEKTLHILPGIGALTTSTTNVASTSAVSKSATTMTPVQSSLIGKNRGGIGTILAMASTILFICFLLVYARKKKNNNLEKKIVFEKKMIPVVHNIISKEDLNCCETAKEINHFLQNYSQVRWSLPANSSLSQIYTTAELKITNFDKQKANSIFKSLENNLYGNIPVDIAKLRPELAEVLFKNDIKMNKIKSNSVLPDLNPS
jgi:hypothetical protein